MLASVILIVGFELLKSSAMKVIHPETVRFSWIVLISLLASIGVKFWMCGFNRKLGRRIDSSVMLATAQDSLNDVVATTATVVSLVLSAFVSWPVDGIMGVIVSIFVLFSGYGIIKDTISELLGQPADKELVSKISDIMLSRPEIMGLHDLIIHSYGPGNLIGSAMPRSARTMICFRSTIRSTRWKRKFTSGCTSCLRFTWIRLKRIIRKLKKRGR